MIPFFCCGPSGTASRTPWGPRTSLWKPLISETRLMFARLMTRLCDLYFFHYCNLSDIQWNLKGGFLWRVLLLLPSWSVDSERWRPQYHITARFIRSEFFYFWTAESFLCLEEKKKKKNFPLTLISSSSSLFGLLLWNIVGSQIIVWCWAAAALAQDISFSPCYQREAAALSDRRTGPSTVLAPHSGRLGSSRSTRVWPPALFRAKFRQNNPKCGMEVAYNETQKNEVGCG